MPFDLDSLENQRFRRGVGNLHQRLNRLSNGFGYTKVDCTEEIRYNERRSWMDHRSFRQKSSLHVVCSDHSCTARNDSYFHGSTNNSCDYQSERE